MPDLKVETFSGDPLRFQFFMTMFETAVEAKTQVPKESKYLIETCLYQEPSVGYQRAKELLKKRYGNPIHVANTYMDKLRSWPRIPDGDGEAIGEFLFSW